ncbi:hypothetical protein CFBP4996_26060 (plasmid) [Agrobacterium leguminum]|nr:MULTISPECIES: hypothetical protein [Agrobacterium]WFS69440.1 hypothetical protein CFBP4996_26060 [Agrobacterium leguminum]
MASSDGAGEVIVNAGTPKPDCRVRVNFDVNRELPGYLTEVSGGLFSYPFMPTPSLIPKGYKGDFYVEEFTDDKIRSQWEACRIDAKRSDHIMRRAKAIVGFQNRKTGSVNPVGKVSLDGHIDLEDVRRPRFFGEAPYNEPIANFEQATSVVEFSVPRDAYEREFLDLHTEIKLRGWYLRGEGVEDAESSKIKSLVIFNNGAFSETTAIDDPASNPLVRNIVTRNYEVPPLDTLTECSGLRHWRRCVSDMISAGFDVLVTDRRGEGISGGRSASNTCEQANDIFRMLEQLNSGAGLRIMTPTGQLAEGHDAATRLMNGASIYEIPIIVVGFSRGSQTAQWFMHKNFVENCNFDGGITTRAPAVGLSNVKGAILFGSNPGSLGYRAVENDEHLIEAALRAEYSTSRATDSDVLANIDKWPAAQFVRGTWDIAEGLEGTLDAYRRVNGMKDISVFLGPHSLRSADCRTLAYITERFVAFARAAISNDERKLKTLVPSDLRELVLSAPHFWEKTTDLTNFTKI